LPAGINPTDARDRAAGPPAQIDVYTGGGVRWADVRIPPSLQLLDERLEAHRFTLEDGVVLEGKITELDTRQPIPGRVTLRRMEPRGLGPERFAVMAQTEADSSGRWVLKKALSGSFQVVIEADGFAPRRVGFAEYEDQPRWLFYDCRLARAAAVSGQVTDKAGQPLGDVEVRFRDVATEPDERYDLPADATAKTDAAGHFEVSQLPRGHASVWVYKFGYCRPGLGLPVNVPAAGVALSMLKSARARVTVDFAGKPKSEAYIVTAIPESGSVPGSWGGSGLIDEHNQITFTDVPPGRYVFNGQPNPASGNETTTPVVAELVSGRLTEITLGAK
jgi:hypothetical protein